MCIDEGNYMSIREADDMIGGTTCENIKWQQEENFIGSLDTDYLIELIEDLTKEIDGLRKLIKEIKEEK
jgi:hypothetical protein